MVQEGCDANPPAPSTLREGKGNTRGRPNHAPPCNLLRRLRDFLPQGWAFMDDFAVPFDKNQAEREVRMVQVKQKVSGGVRPLDEAKRFRRIRGSISPARKHSQTVFEAIRDACGGNPFLPSPDSQPKPLSSQ